MIKNWFAFSFFLLKNSLKSKSHAAQASSPWAAAQPGAQGDAELRFGLFPPSFVRPRPLALALGASNVKGKRGLPSGRVSGLESL